MYVWACVWIQHLQDSHPNCPIKSTISEPHHPQFTHPSYYSLTNKMSNTHTQFATTPTIRPQTLHEYIYFWCRDLRDVTLGHFFCKRPHPLCEWIGMAKRTSCHFVRERAKWCQPVLRRCLKKLCVDVCIIVFSPLASRMFSEIVWDEDGAGLEMMCEWNGNGSDQIPFHACCQTIGEISDCSVAISIVSSRWARFVKYPMVCMENAYIKPMENRVCIFMKWFFKHEIVSSKSPI